MGRDSVVSIATGYGLDGPMGARFSALVHTCPGAHPASYIMGTGSLTRGVKRSVCAVDHPHHLAPRFKKE